ncbi:MAG: hypothetical protein ACOX1N_05070 [Candidatus Methanomethylophilaceae archaeon]|jgi:hypothetical protein
MILNRGVPKEISAVKLKKWFKSLDERDGNRISRYASGADTSSQIAFITDIMSKANAEENYAVALIAGEFGNSLDMNEDERFDFLNEYIESLFFSGDSCRAKDLCHENLELVPKVLTSMTAEGIPERMPCRNRLIDILVGVEGDYDGANEMLVRFNEMNILSDEDLEFRIQSLRIHRLQRTFDSVFTLKPRE